MAKLTDRHRDGKPPLDSRKSGHVETLAKWLMQVADRDYRDAFTEGSEGVPAKYRLSRAKLEEGAPKRARWVIEHWSPGFLERKRRGGRHGAADGITKGPKPRFTVADLLPYIWELPPHEAKRAVQDHTGMSDSTYYRLVKDSQVTRSVSGN
jgi:hypothetical protein